MPCETLSDQEFLAEAVAETLKPEHLEEVIEDAESDLPTDGGAAKRHRKLKRRVRLDETIAHYIVEAQRRDLSDEYTKAVQEGLKRAG